MSTTANSVTPSSGPASDPTETIPAAALTVVLASSTTGADLARSGASPVANS